MMAAATAVPGGKLGQRLGQPGVLAVSTTIFALGFCWWTWQAGSEPNYFVAILPGLLLTGIGVGPTIPNISTAGVASLPKGRYATGSAVLSMSRQIGAAIGVAIFVAILGKPGPGEVLSAFERGWVACGALGLSAGLVCLSMGVIYPAVVSRRSTAALVSPHGSSR
jgi:hypothetical protein